MISFSNDTFGYRSTSSSTYIVLNASLYTPGSVIPMAEEVSSNAIQGGRSG